MTPPTPGINVDTNFSGLSTGNLTGQGDWVAGPAGDGPNPSLTVTGTPGITCLDGYCQNIMPLDIDTTLPYSFEVFFNLFTLTDFAFMLLMVEDSTTGNPSATTGFSFNAPNETDNFGIGMNPTLIDYLVAHKIKLDFDGTNTSFYFDDVLVGTPQLTPPVASPALSISIFAPGLEVTRVKFTQAA